MKDVAGVRCRRSIRRGRPYFIGFASGAKMEDFEHIRQVLLTESVNNLFAVLKRLVTLIPNGAKTAACVIAIRI